MTSRENMTKGAKEKKVPASEGEAMCITTVRYWTASVNQINLSH